ncbi:MAG: trehalose-phosphatase [Candidatus Omnitrophica bacterium]|nr:trehalose-phosphatase [Candidatus Omnitrophota bacterium]
MPQHLFDEWDEVRPDLRDRDILLFLDYDGTLTPIKERPEMAKLHSEVRNILRALARQEDVQIAIISGRSLSNLEKLIRIPGLTYVGNHGLELHGPKIRHVHPSAQESKLLLHKIAMRLKKAFGPLPGIIVENKIFTLSVHYRQLDPNKIDFAKRLLFKEIGHLLGKSQIVFKEGKMVWELRPAVEWDKGKTVLWLFARVLTRARGRVWPVYVGDDLTDEDAFRVLKGKGLAVKVTQDSREATEAPYYLESAGEVLEFLKRIYQMKIARKYGARDKAAQSA